MNYPTRSLASFVQSIQKLLASLLTEENTVPIVASTHHIIDRSLKFNPHLPCHIFGFYPKIYIYTNSQFTE